MNILITPDSFKETLSAIEVSNSIENSFIKIFNDANIVKIPMADGGEGTVDSLIYSTKGEFVEVEVLDPLRRVIKARYGILGDNQTAVIEMAASSGLELLSDEEKNPMKTTTYGFGQLINHAIDRGIKNFIFGIGGSATNDCGIGMLQALGVKFYDKNKNELPLITPEIIHLIADFNDFIIKEKFKDISVQVACDVSNILCGIKGASHTFGPQKGADYEMVEKLDLLLKNFSKICISKYNVDNTELVGTGASGGLGYGLLTFLNAELKSGIEIVMDIVRLEERIKNSDLIITGEGKIDYQTINGKTIMGISKLAKKYDKKVIAIAGCLGKDYELVYNHGVDIIFDTTIISSDFETIKKNAKKSLEFVAFNIAKSLKIKIK